MGQGGASRPSTFFPGASVGVRRKRGWQLAGWLLGLVGTAEGRGAQRRRVSLEEALGWAGHIHAPPSLGQVFGARAGPSHTQSAPGRGVNLGRLLPGAHGETDPGE